MALLLAPYNEAMQLGMGCTQQLCVNDIVRRPGGIRATEADLRAQPGHGAQTGFGSSSNTSLDLTKQSGSAVVQRRDGQATVSQVVTWKASFVDKVSEVLDSLNISGQLAISVDALGGGAGGGGNYLKSTQITKSTVTWTVTVKVTNQNLIGNDITEFSPIPNVQPADFNEVYGDCFISGFVQGGVFNAVVSKTIADEDKKLEYGGNLSIKLDLAKVAKVEGSAQGSKKENDKTIAHDTTITVDWSGGGDIKPDSIKEWDIPNLIQVAMEFPDAVAACPQKTFAILTKYTSLRSYREQSIKGTPLDYENAGIYTSVLVNAYMDYKLMWKDLEDLTKGVRDQRFHIKSQDTHKKFIKYNESFKKDYDNRLDKYNAAEKQVVKSASVRSQDPITLEPPLPPNAIIPYEADIFGLESAKTDCRFEMIKIVREANEVALNPKVATDPLRLWRFLSPNIFRMLLPEKDTNAKKPLSPDEEANLKRELTEAVAKETTARLDAQRYKSEYEAIKKQQFDEREAWRTAGEEQRKKASEQEIAAREQKAAEKAEADRKQAEEIARQKKLVEDVAAQEKKRLEDEGAVLRQRLTQVEGEKTRLESEVQSQKIAAEAARVKALADATEIEHLRRTAPGAPPVALQAVTLAQQAYDSDSDSD